MATLQGYRIQALNLAMAWHNKGYVPTETDLLVLANTIYEFITQDISMVNNSHCITINGELFYANPDGSFIKVKD
jgi:hypothetical protein